MELIATTERLRILRFTKNDAAFILELVNSPSWLRYIGDRQIGNLARAETYLENGPLKSYAENGFGGYCLEETETGKKIGSCGFYKRDGLEHPDLGFALLPEFEGKGYAFEASQKLLELWRTDFPTAIVAAITSRENERSIQLLQRLGFSWNKFVTLPNDYEELNLFLLNPEHD